MKVERLTHKVDGEYYPIVNTYGYQNIRKNIHTKLGQLEDIEEELGIPLEVLFKALKEGVYWKTYQDKAEHSYMGLFEAQTGGFYLGDDEYNDVFTKDYGKTWWLEKPKEEKDD